MYKETSFNSRGAGKIHQRSARLEQTRLLCFNSRGAGKIHRTKMSSKYTGATVSIPAARVRYIPCAIAVRFTTLVSIPAARVRYILHALIRKTGNPIVSIPAARVRYIVGMPLFMIMGYLVSIPAARVRYIALPETHALP